MLKYDPYEDLHGKINALIKKKFLENSDEKEVYKYLKRTSKKRVGLFFYKKSKEIEAALLKRNLPLINLGLAQYAFNSEIISHLYNNEDKAIKIAALTNKENRWLTEEIIKKILFKEDEDFQIALLSHPNVNLKILENLYEKKEIFSDLDEKNWQALIYFSSENQQIRIHPYRDYEPWDPCVLRYDRIINAAWKLADKVKTTREWAAILSKLLSDIIRPKTDIDIESTILRWRVEKNDDKYTPYSSLRIALAAASHCQKRRYSDDWAMRMAYYKNYHSHKLEDLDEYFKKDKEDFLQFSLRNIYFYNIDKNICNKLSTLAEESGMYNVFKHFEKKFINEDPKSFEDDESRLEWSDKFILNDLKNETKNLHYEVIEKLDILLIGLRIVIIILIIYICYKFYA